MTSLSKSWRVNKSTIPAIEIANILRGLSKVIGGVSPMQEQVLLGGMSYNQVDRLSKSRTIVIDRKFVLASGQFPIPDEDFDILVGLASHEAGHTISQSILPKDAIYDGNNLTALSADSFTTIAEEIYTDNFIKRHKPKHSEYLQRARKAYISDLSTEYSIAKVWLDTAVYNKSIDINDLPTTHQPVYSILNILTDTLSKADLDYRERKELYGKVYQAISKLLAVDEIKEEQGMKNSALDNKALSTLGYEPRQDHSVDTEGKPTASPSTESDNSKDQDDQSFHSDSSQLEPLQSSDKLERPGRKRRSRKLLLQRANYEAQPSEPVPSEMPEEIKKLLDDAMEALESNTEDVTEQLSEVLQPIASTYDEPIIYKQSKNGIDKYPIDEKLLRELDWIKRLKNSMSRRTSRSQPEGALDRRRLHHHQTNGLIYKTARVQQRQKLDLVLLLDASSSMHTKRDIYKAAKTLYTIIPEAQVLSYDYEGNYNLIQNHTYDGTFRKIETNGGTPSGRALLVAAMKFPRSLIIHFTDGASNTDVSPAKILSTLNEKYPQVQIVNILFQGRDNQYPEYSFSSTKVIDRVDEFPEALKDGLKSWYRTF
jgi:hypothetical protein